MRPDEPGAGAAGPGPTEDSGAARTNPGSPESADGPAPEAEGDHEASTRERIEEALRRRNPDGFEASGPASDRERSGQGPPREAAGAKHWSWAIRKQVAERGSAPAPGAESAAGGGAGGGGAVAESPAAPPSDDIRQRIERRLQEAEEARHHEPGPVGAPPTPAPGPESGVGAAPAVETAPETATEWDAPWEEEEGEPVPAGEALPVRPPSRLAAFIATCAFIGRAPIAPGTAGAAAGLVAFLLTRNLAVGVPVALLAVAIALGTWAGGRHAKDLRQPDPRSVVVDEFCGMWLALVGANPSYAVMAAAFVAFRFLDIAKPPPVRQAERLPGGIGIMADDLVAGGIVRVALLLTLGM